MNKPSSTIQASALGGGVAAVLFGLFAIFLPEYYDLVPAGMEAGTAVVIGTLVGYFTKETVLNVQS